MAQKQRPKTRYERWFDREDDPDGDFTFGEVVWNAARKDLLKQQRQRRRRKARSSK